MEGSRTETRQLGRNLIHQGMTGLQEDLDKYLEIENETMLKLARMQIQIAQKEEQKAVFTPPAAEVSNMSDSGVFSFVEREAPQKPKSESLSSVHETVQQQQDVLTRSQPGSTFCMAPPRQLTAARSEDIGGARQRTYADVAKTPAKSVILPPPVVLKSDTQRHLELALEEWRQRLSRLDSLINEYASTEHSTDPANEIVSQFVCLHLPVQCDSLFLVHFQARLIASCRSTNDLAHHLFKRLSSEMSNGDIHSDQVEALRHRLTSMSNESKQLELVARTRERQLRDDR